jgi:hypothetical protein
MKMLLVLLSIFGTLGTNAQLLTTTEKIPLGEFQKIPNSHRPNNGLSPTVMLSVAHNHFYQFSLRNKKGICVPSHHCALGFIENGKINIKLFTVKNGE